MIRGRPLRWQLLVLQLVIVFVTVAGTGVVATWMQQVRIRDAYEAKMVGVAKSVARMPVVVDAYKTDDPSAIIQPVAEVIRKSSDLAYVVVTDRQGIRLSHPNPERIGEPVSTDASVPLSGLTYVGTQTGTLGRSWRVKVPVRDENSTIIGTVSVGTLEQDLRSDLLADLPSLVAWLVLASLAGTVGALWISRLVWRRIYRQEPEQIAALLETRDAMLHGIGEGIVALDAKERVVLVNDEARRLMAIGEDVVGKPARDVLDVSVQVLLDSGSSDDELVLGGERVLLAQRRDAVVDDRIVGSVLILRDRTELRAVLRDLDGARDVTQALRAQAHEYSNAMHVVSGLLELGRADEAVDFISRSSRFGAGEPMPMPADVVDAELVALLMTKVAMGSERGIEVVVSADSNFDFDGSSDVVTVVGNLLDNAIEAIGSRGRIDISIRQADDLSVTVEVGDDGPGIAAESQDKVFEPGVSTKDAGPSRTRGIGLALVARIAERRAGNVKVEPYYRGGARLIVELGPPIVMSLR